jgi:hypothetical protein
MDLMINFICTLAPLSWLNIIELWSLSACGPDGFQFASVMESGSIWDFFNKRIFNYLVNAKVPLFSHLFLFYNADKEAFSFL